MDENQLALLANGAELINIPQSELRTISFVEIASLGAGCAAALAPLQQIAQASGNSEILYRAVDKGMNAISLPFQAKDGIGFVPGIKGPGNTLTNARFVPVNTSITTNMSAVYNPTLMFVAIAMADINRKLDSILESQREIRDYLKDNKRSELQGNAAFLSNVLENYKFNLDNAIYKTSMHVKSQDIKQHAEQNISFYRVQITAGLGSFGSVATNRAVQQKLSKLMSDFEDYRISLHLFAFSSFLEVLLLENFASKYLRGVADRIEAYAYEYRELYSESYDRLEKYTKSSVQTTLLGGLASASDTLGNVIAKVPVISRSQIDENLIKAGDSLEKQRHKSSNKALKEFSGFRDIVIHPFAERIRAIDELYNQTTELLFDSDNVYLRRLEETSSN